MQKPDPEVLSRLLDSKFKKSKIPAAVLRVESGDNSFSWTGATGAMNTDSRYFIASVTKMYITAVVMRLAQAKLLKPEDRITQFFPKDLMAGLHVLKGIEYTDKITIRHLISNTSGLPDYFFHKQQDGKTAADRLLEGIDEPWDLNRTLDAVKKLTPRFVPGKKGKAAYSDTNYQIMGGIIEKVTGKPIGKVFKEYIFDALKLSDTYAYHDVNDKTPVPFHYKMKQLWVPNYMTSITPEGGIVSTAEENMIFLKAFFQGKFFHKEGIEQMKKWNLILPPPGLFFYGIGLEKIWTPWFISPFKPIREILGFWGQTGSFAWYNPDTDLYFCGTTNQIDGSGHSAAAAIMIRIIKSVL